jgi:hypothetical protein
MRFSVSAEYQLPLPRPPIRRLPMAFMSSIEPGITPAIRLPGSIPFSVPVGAAEAFDGADCGEEEAANKRTNPANVTVFEALRAAFIASPQPICSLSKISEELGLTQK